MRKIFLSVGLILSITACNNSSSTSNEKKDTVKTTITTPPPKDTTSTVQHVDESGKAKEWLVNMILEHINKDKFPMKSVTTKDYNEYKQDALDVVYGDDHVISQEQFDKKWKAKYDTKHAGIGTGFLISGQDYGKVKVPVCELAKRDGDNYYFKTVIEDIQMKIKYHRDIKVVKAGESFLIDDVVEYD